MISEHFKREEFACQCGCGFDTVDCDLLEILEAVREHFDKPVMVTSGCRCPEHNKSVGGAPTSFHIYGRAADIVVKDVWPSEVYAYLDNYATPGLGLYSGWVHVDSRSGRGRWGT